MLVKAQLQLCQRCLWCCRSQLRLLSQSVATRKSANYYDLLGVKSDASLEEIKNAFFDKSKKLHPDKDLSDPSLHSQFVELNEAYRVLSKELSRKEYDVRISYQYRGSRPFTSTQSSYRASTSAGAQDSMRYWEQFHQYNSPEMTREALEKRRRTNLRLVGYCLLAMLFSIAAHFILFRKLEQVHNDFMDEKDRIITEIYNESKERARVNGFKKQSEILRQKQAEFREKYNMRNIRGDK